MGVTVAQPDIQRAYLSGDRARCGTDRCLCDLTAL